MGLYLCVFESPRSDEELEGVEVGGYDDFHSFRATVAERLEGGTSGSRFPVLMSHSDSDGEWSPAEAEQVRSELSVIARELAAASPVPFIPGTWQAEVARTVGLSPDSLADCFFDIDGEALIGRLLELANVAVAQGAPISFQ